jgi:hypothetical protein
MPAYARRDIVDDDGIGVYHCIPRCVRRAFLCGTDSYTGRDYSHRKAWVLDRLRQLAGLFGVEVCGYAVSNRRSAGVFGRWSFKSGSPPSGLEMSIERRTRPRTCRANA